MLNIFVVVKIFLIWMCVKIGLPTTGLGIEVVNPDIYLRWWWLKWWFWEWYCLMKREGRWLRWFHHLLIAGGTQDWCSIVSVLVMHSLKIFIRLSRYLDIWERVHFIPISRSGHHLCVYAPQMDEPGLLFCSRPKDSWGFPRFQPDRGQWLWW